MERLQFGKGSRVALKGVPREQREQGEQNGDTGSIIRTWL